MNDNAAPPRVIRPGRPTVCTTWQFKGTIEPKSDGSLDALLITAREIITTWIENKFPSSLPAAVRDGKSFVIAEHGQSIQAVSIPELGVWSARLVQPDAPYGDRGAVAGRIWTTEIALTTEAESGVVHVGTRVLCASLPYGEAPIALTRPRFIIDLAHELELKCIRRIAADPWRIESMADINELYEFLTDPSRRLAVYLLTQPEPSRDEVAVRDYLLDEVELSKRLEGIGFVVLMPREINPAWTEGVGKIWSAFMGAMRTYRPGIDFERDAPSNHPLALADRILSFDRDGRVAEETFADLLVARAYQDAASRSVDWQPCTFYVDALARESEIARNHSSDDAVWKQLYEQEIAALRDGKREAEGIAESYARDVDTLTARLAEADDENNSFRNYVETLRAQVESKTGVSADESITFPSDLVGLPEWVKQHLSGRVVLHPRAIRALKGAHYEKPELIFQALLALGREYCDRQCGKPDANTRWDAKLDQLGLRFDRSMKPSRAGEFDEQYSVRYPVGTSSKRLLDFHLCKGSSKDERLCLRIYFFWDDAKSRVVIGWLPSHLDTRAT